MHVAKPDVIKRFTIGASLSVLGLIAVTTLLIQPAQDEVRHTLSHGSSLGTFDAAGTVWARRSFVREIWVSPDGSGRIDERDSRLTFPNQIERAEWVALGSPAPPTISRTFGSGELAYVRLDGMPSDPSLLLRQITAGGAEPTDVLREVALLLYENVPPRDLTLAVVGALRQVPGVDTDERRNLATFTATDESSSARSTIVIDLASGQLVSERRFALVPLPGLAVDPPILMLERVIDATDLLDSSATLGSVTGRGGTLDRPDFSECIAGEIDDARSSSVGSPCGSRRRNVRG